LGRSGLIENYYMSKVIEILRKEEKRQKTVINLIPSENYVSKNVLRALGSVFTNKYAEGKSGFRYYSGNKFTDELEDYVKELGLKVFGASSKEYGINVQPYSGSIANLAAYLSVLKSGDKILAMSLEHGGHLTHGHKVSMTGQLFSFSHYGVNTKGFIDYKDILKIAKKFRPKLIVAGATAYPREINFKKFREIADEVGALLMADVSHIAGLIVGGVHLSPIPYADIVTSTTHKTLRGPRGAIIISKHQIQKSKFNLTESIDKTVFPGLQGGPQMHTIAAMGVAFEEALQPSFKKYANQVVKNAKKLAEELKRAGFKLISGGTDNHLILVDVTSLGLLGKEAADRLEANGIIVNKNSIPFDTRKPWDPSGIRLGTPAVTTQGMKEEDMVEIAKRIAETLISKS